MKILHANIGDDKKLAAAILRNLERLVCTHAYAVKDGWRSIIELQNTDEKPYFQLDVQSNRGGGNYAEAKMAMLKHYPDLPATGLDTPAALVERIRSFLCDRPTGQEIPYVEVAMNKIAALDYIEQMPKSTAEFLRKHGLTSYKGAIRIPYEILFCGGKIEPTAGEIRIAFSGAEEWQDMYFATDILADLQQSLNELWIHDQIWLNLRGLEADPQTNMWLKLLNVREA